MNDIESILSIIGGGITVACALIALARIVIRQMQNASRRHKRLDDLEAQVRTLAAAQRVESLETLMNELPCAARQIQLERLDERTAAQTARIAQLDDRLYQHADRLARLDGHDH